MKYNKNTWLLLLTIYNAYLIWHTCNAVNILHIGKTRLNTWTIETRKGITACGVGKSLCYKQIALNKAFLPSFNPVNLGTLLSFTRFPEKKLSNLDLQLFLGQSRVLLLYQVSQKMSCHHYNASYRKRLMAYMPFHHRTVFCPCVVMKPPHPWEVIAKVALLLLHILLENRTYDDDTDVPQCVVQETTRCVPVECTTKPLPQKTPSQGLTSDDV